MVTETRKIAMKSLMAAHLHLHERRCFFCEKPIRFGYQPDDPNHLHWHHPGQKNFNISGLKAKGWIAEMGVELALTVPVHKSCHETHHKKFPRKSRTSRATAMTYSNEKMT